MESYLNFPLYKVFSELRRHKAMKLTSLSQFTNKRVLLKAKFFNEFMILHTSGKSLIFKVYTDKFI